MSETTENDAGTVCHEFVDTGRCGHSDAEHDALANATTEDARPVTAAVPLVERLAEALAEHGAIAQSTRPGRRSGLTEWFAHCVCGEEMPWNPGDRNAAHLRHQTEALLPVVEQAVAEARGEALWQATNDWQWGQWTVLTEPIKAEAQPQRIIGAAQAVTDWLRERAKASTKETP